MERIKIVSRAQTGKVMVSHEKQAFIEKEVAYYLDFVAREFRSGLLDGKMCQMLTKRTLS